MRTLTLTNPWASLVACGAKRIETRSWRTSHRGPLAIHAAKGFPADAKRLCESRMVCRVFGWPECPSPLAQEWLDDNARRIKSLPLGAVIATCRLVSCIPTREIREGSVIPVDPSLGCPDFEMTEREYVFGNYDPGRWAWLLADITPLPKPDPCKGALSLWEWDDVNYWKMREGFGKYGDATTPGFFV